MFPHRVGKSVLILYICLLVNVCPDLDICLFQESQKVPKLTINLGPKKPTEHAFFAVSLSNIIINKSLSSFSDQILIILTLISHCLLRACLYSNSLLCPRSWTRTQEKGTRGEARSRTRKNTRRSTRRRRKRNTSQIQTPQTVAQMSSS